MGSPSYHANETKQRELDYEERKQKPLLDQRNKVNQGVYNKNKKAIDIFQNKLRSDVNAQFKMRGLDPKSNDPAVRKILESIVDRAKSKNDKYMRSLGIRTNMPRPKQRPTGTPIPRRRPTGTPVPQGISPRRKSSLDDVAKARAAYAEMMRRRVEARNKQKLTGEQVPQAKQKPTGTPTPPKRRSRGRRPDTARARAMREFNANRLKSKGKPVVQKQVVVPKAEQKVPQAKESPASIAARKRFNDRLKRQTATYNKTKPTTANQKGIPPSAIKKMQDANKKMQARLFGGGKKPTTKRTFART